MGTHIRQSFSLLANIEVLRRAEVRNAIESLQQVMSARHAYGRFLRAALHPCSKDSRVVHQFPLQLIGHVEPLRHRVVENKFLAFGGRDNLLELRELSGLDDPRFVGKNVKTGPNARVDIVDGLVVSSGDHQQVGRLFGQHPLKEIVAGVHMQPPVVRRGTARLQVCDEA